MTNRTPGRERSTRRRHESARCRKGSSTSWVHVWADVFSEKRPGALGIPAIEEEHQAHGGKHPRADSPNGDMARHHRAGGQVGGIKRSSQRASWPIVEVRQV